MHSSHIASAQRQQSTQRWKPKGKYTAFLSITDISEQLMHIIIFREMNSSGTVAAAGHNGLLKTQRV